MIVRLDLRQDFRHAVDIGLAADEPDVRKGLRLRDQMLAAAESDFEPDIGDVAIEQVGKPRGCGCSDVERQMRQQIVDQVGLMDAELVALAAAEERAARMCGRAIIRRRVAVAGIAWGSHHRSVWYSRYSSRALGSIEEMYICS